MEPMLNQVVVYTSKVGDGIQSPAIPLRTPRTTDLDVIGRWKTAADTLSGKGRPEALVADLGEGCVDLLVHGLGGDYREYNVPHDEHHGPGTWTWSQREA